MLPRCAVVTGASSGIGEALARRLARDGADVVLVARDAARLERLAVELESAHRIRALPLPVDLVDPRGPARVFDEVSARNLAVDVLVNNAGFGSSGSFLELDLTNELAMIAVNCSALVDLTHRLARGMVARGGGRILNIASTAAFQAGPYMATYYASKAFVLSFSEALAHELAATGVRVTCSCPGATATGFARRAGTETSKLFLGGNVASAGEVADQAYEAMLEGVPVVVHGALNKLGVVLQRFGPRAWARQVAASLNRS